MGRPLSLSPRPYPIICAALLLCALSAPSWAKPKPQQSGPTGPKIWLQDNQPLQVVYHAATASSASRVASGTEQNANLTAAQVLTSGQVQPLALAEGDFDADGVEDLVVGYAAPGGGILAIHRGNLDAFAPQSDASFQAIARGQFPSPFLADVRVLSLPVRPDFVAVGSFAESSYPDIVVAARGDSSIYLLANDGKGNFSAPQSIKVTGGVTTLSAGNLGNGGAFTHLVVGVSDANNSYSLLVLGNTGVGFGSLAWVPLSAPASNILFGDFGDSRSDVAFLSGG